jgi:aminopeptidase-like protein/aminoglycoside N3'-acetyltransferase
VSSQTHTMTDLNTPEAAPGASGTTNAPATSLGYGYADLVESLKKCGVKQGDIVFFHISISELGRPECALAQNDINAMLFSALKETVGQTGTIFLPAFSLSFENNENFDLASTPAANGAWSRSTDFLEYFRNLPGVVRSCDPNWSVAGFGPRADELLRDLPRTSFGKDCLYERLVRVKAKICCIGGKLHDSAFLRFVEESAGAPTCYRKLTTGLVYEDGHASRQGWVTTITGHRKSSSDAGHIETVLREDNGCRAVGVGDGQILAIECRRFCDVVQHQVSRNPWFTDATWTEASSDSSDERSRVELSPSASMEELIERLWWLPRDIVSDGYDTALHALSTQLPMTIHEYPTGTECWTWLVPEKWTCREARLETLDGHRLFSYADNPLHVVSYSLPIDRVVSRQELFEHLHVHPELPDAIPFIFKYYERDWGLCCSQALKASLRDDRYRVVIRSEFNYGSLKVGEVVVPGKSDKTFVLCSHLCHPAMVNDDLSGVVVGLKVMQELLKRSDLRYTYRFLILPETIGSVAYLSHHEELIPDMIGGLFLEMLGLNNPHALEMSFRGDTDIDECCSRVLEEGDLEGWTGPFRTVVGNDERQFNAPGVRVPMLSLSRVMRNKKGRNPYYPEYHSSHDNPGIASPARLAESCELVLRMLDAIEECRVPVNRYHGEIFCSRYGLNIDAYSCPQGNRAFFDILFQIDGTKSIGQIARVCKISEDSVQAVLNELEGSALITYRGEV